MSDDFQIEFQYSLKRSFSYSHKGDTVDAKFITLTAPTSRTAKECSALKQAFFRAMSEQQTVTSSGEATNTDLEIEGGDVMALLAMSTEVDLPDVLDVGKKLFQQPGIALVDGEAKLGGTLIDRMSLDDFEDMLGEYMVNFILASSLTRLKDKSFRVSQT
jgi:hypothetical protein